jgi:hypothetical protein
VGAGSVAGEVPEVMHGLHGFLFICFCILVSSGCQSEETSLYQVADDPWPESFGNHRAVLEISSDEEAIRIDLPWRRHDRDPHKRMLLLVSAETGDTIGNIHRIRVDGEKCEILAGPLKAGSYHFYYLPFEVQEGYGFYNKGYLPLEDPPDQLWLEKAEQSQAPLARLLRFEARTDLDMFYPMEVIPFESEKEAFLQVHNDTFLIFTEDRGNPVRMWDEIPYKWILEPKLNHFSGKAMRNEYYVFQLGLYASMAEVEDLQLSFSPLKGKDGSELESSRLTCFNTEGIDTYGNPFTKEIDIRQDRMQALWIGVDIPEDASPGSYHGSILVGPETGKKQEVSIELEIEREILADRGDSEPWRHSRLRWLNSTAGIDTEPVAPYTPIRQNGEYDFELYGKNISSGARRLPSSIQVGEREILKGPVAFRVIGQNKEEEFSESSLQSLENRGGILSSSWTMNSEHMEFRGEGSLESDGYMRYNIQLKALQDFSLKDIKLEIPFRKEIAQYMMGMGLPGSAVPEHHQSHWDGPEDSFWIGNTRGGLWVELRGSRYHGPLLNLYHPPPPESWANDGLGGFRIESSDNEVLATVFTGARELEKGDELDFEFAMLITPVKPLNQASQFLDRYYHNSGKPDPGPEDLEAGVRIVNLHHANPFNPFINYPFKAVDVMKPFVERNQAKGLKVKIYYTIRELSNHLPEIWALRSLQDEIFAFGAGGGYPWLREHLLVAYRPQWYDHADDTRVDASILTASGDSRWINYYIEGLGWLIRNVGIDGLYMDDVSFDRHIMKRIRKVMDSEKPGCIIDLHSNTGFSKGPATQYAEYFPYVDKLWFGESFMYDEMSWENWLVEVSGIPFGHMGDMLHGGGNPWLGMVFGMTARLPWSTEGVTCNPVAIWKVWDDFKIDQSRMSGFWEEENLVETGNPVVKATAYIHNEKVLISIGNFSDELCKIKLEIDWEQLEFGPDNTRLVAPEIQNFQESLEAGTGEWIELKPRKGWLFYLEAT